MKFTRGTKLKIVGPASLALIDGDIEVLGSKVRRRDRLSIPVAKSIIVNVLENSIIELSLGDGGKVEEIKEESVPYDWREVTRRVLSRPKPLTVLVLGDVDSGKSAFSNYLLNNALLSGFKTVLIDTDLGQSEIGAPTTISMTLLKRPIPSLSKAKMTTGFFVGSTSPEGLIHRVLMGVKLLHEEACSLNPDIIIINTDGWIDDWEAIELKAGMIMLLRPNVIVAIEKKGELESIIKPFELNPAIEIIRLIPLPGTRRRSLEERRIIRQGMYRKYLVEGRIRTYYLDRISLIYTSIGASTPLSKSEESLLRNILGDKMNYVRWGGKTPHELIIFVDRNLRLAEKELEEIREAFEGRRVKVIRKGLERGLIVGLLDEKGLLKGLGVLMELDFTRNVIKVLTPVDEKVSMMAVGLMRLDENLNETQKFKELVL